MKTLFAVLLIAASKGVLANETATRAPVQSAQKPAPDVAAKKVTSKNVGRATAKPFLTGERPQNAVVVLGVPWDFRLEDYPVDGATGERIVPVHVLNLFERAVWSV